MQEAEVSLWIALNYIKNNHTDQDVKVSIDGAHIKTGNTIHFDIWKFINEHEMSKADGNLERWQGEYVVYGHQSRIIISSVPGIGDVNIILRDGSELYIESKKGKNDKKRSRISINERSNRSADDWLSNERKYYSGCSGSFFRKK